MELGPAAKSAGVQVSANDRHGPAKRGGENIMANESPTRRMTLRQLLTQSEKCTRDLIEFCHGTLMTRVSDFRDLSRPVRRRSQYPSMVAVQNSLKKLQEAHQEAQVLTDYLHEQLHEIQERAQKERADRAQAW